MKQEKRASSFTGRTDLRDDYDLPFCSSSGPTTIDRMNCVLTSAEFIAQTHAHSCSTEELLPRQSLCVVQMMGSSSCSDDEKDAEMSLDTDKKQSKNVQLPIDSGSGYTSREEHDEGLIGDNKHQGETSIPFGDEDNDVQTTCHESDLTIGVTIAEGQDKANTMQQEPNNPCRVEQNPAGDTFQDEDCESQPVCTENVITRETFVDEDMHEDFQTALIE
ncbi:hypothetical protein SEMRO_2804_G337480.1 [Seminavis robusta]|uniref:Uncharacterized protein n=1 Tax=Seminavis robusta TaxID=568900 RepID=A0A9N8F3V4_9STRA|nr:hypothetical protein SEMRO_2804_G337480.1 [Seminavis robusta]|eukprot:Sro2804_g337480.1 n/a (219) ;mRNA; r:10739-11395